MAIKGIDDVVSSWQALQHETGKKGINFADDDFKNTMKNQTPKQQEAQDNWFIDHYTKEIDDLNKKIALQDVVINKVANGDGPSHGKSQYDGQEKGLESLQQDKLGLIRQKAYAEETVRLAKQNLEEKKKVRAASSDLNKGEAKELKELIKLAYEDTDSIYQLQLAKLNRIKNTREALVNNKNLSLEAQIEAHKSYSEIMLKIIDVEGKKEINALDKKQAEEFQKNEQNLAQNKKITEKNKKDGLISEQEYYAKMAEAQAMYLNNKLEIQKTHDNMVAKSAIDTSEKMRKITDEDIDFMYAKLKELRNLDFDAQQAVLERQQAHYSRLSEDEKYSINFRQEAFDNRRTCSWKSLTKITNIRLP